jgi:hypothetical protein
MDHPAAAKPQMSPISLLYHFCRLQLPAVALSPEKCAHHLERTFKLFQAKHDRSSAGPVTWQAYLNNFYPLDWYVASACLEGDPRAWEYLFSARAGRADCLLTDALRARAVRLYPRDDERQDSAVNEFWGHLYAPETAGAVPVLARYDAQRPLVPWLIRVFQNWHVSQLRRRGGVQALPDDDLAPPLPPEGDGRWHDAFCQAARECLGDLSDIELLILGLRLRYRMSQREVAMLLGIHEGTVSRKTDQLRDRCLEHISKRLQEQGWTGDDLFDYVRTEMSSLLLDDPRLSADHLARLLADKGKKLP